MAISGLNKTHTIFSWGIIIIFSLIFYYLTSIFYWSSDSPYFALQFEMDDSDPHRAINSITDLFASQCAHYMNWSGRFFCQFIVQIFCALTERPIFEICNIFVWLLFIFTIFKFAETKLNDTFSIFITTSIFFLIFLTLPLDPPFLINYLWMGFIIVLWIKTLLSYRNYRIIYLPLLFLFSVIAGNTQEAFSLPLAGALILCLILKKIKLSKSQIIPLAGFLLGTLILIIAPGNYIRLSIVEHSQISIFRNIWGAWPSLLIFIALLTFVLPNYKELIRNVASKEYFDISIVFIILSLLMAGVMKFANFSRILIPDNILLLICFAKIVSHKSNFPYKIFSLLMVLISILSIFYEIRLFKTNHLKYSLISEKYHKSLDGRVYIPDSLFLKNSGQNNYYNHGFTIQERHFNPQKPELIIHSESIEHLKINPDTNCVIQIAPQGWLITQSIDNPQNIIVNRYLFPILKSGRIRIPDRIINLSQTDQNLICDTLNNNIIGYYINDKWYMSSSISIAD